jgi:hypothetical protein
MCSYQDKTFALRTLFKFEQAQYGFAILGVTTQAVAGFRGISDKATVLQVGRNASCEGSRTIQAILSD